MKESLHDRVQAHVHLSSADNCETPGVLVDIQRRLTQGAVVDVYKHSKVIEWRHYKF